MKKLIQLAFVALAIIATSCEKKDDTTLEQTNTDIYGGILDSYVNKTVIPTYKGMKDNSKDLLTKVKALQTNKTDANVVEACKAWQATRKYWEQSEAFLFGPADERNLDPYLDSWPLDLTQLEQVLASNETLSASNISDTKGAQLRGFHTIEYLMFRKGKARAAAEITAREMEYLSGVTEVLRNECVLLYSSWAGAEKGTNDAEILEGIDKSISVPYGPSFVKSGKVGGAYPIQVSAVDQILQGILDIADEVGNQKLGSPHKSGNPLDVESWYSWNSLLDFQDNVRSIKHSYIGGIDAKNTGASLSDIVKKKNPELDKKVLENIELAISKIGAIPSPFRNNLTANEVTVAMEQLNALNDIFTKEVRPIFVK
ncbi:hypothetical protein K5X82_11580 [Halosquirtibacter xylanolyticus]|uniref:imelysin family protein n=1 Tax=Halosquirtibacter xylanolyticus TaxID=3374599 RepID=UPI0037484EDC|nr:hypothetical protein K5X82_11580 [Prolixibacteraceae bacterium]